MRNKKPTEYSHVNDWGLHFNPNFDRYTNEVSSDIFGFHAPIVNMSSNEGTNKMLETVDYVSNQVKYSQKIQKIQNTVNNETYLTIHLHNGIPPQYDKLVENLKGVVEYAKEKNIKVCVENLRKGFSSNPNNILKVVENCDCNITIDIGHIKYENRLDTVDLFAEYIHNVHVYENEIDGKHIAPKNLDNLKPVLDKLLNYKKDFWLVELMDNESCQNTKNMLTNYLMEYF
ncbi:sugar phosphate isomerase/epimerase family protein [Methanococcus voltae]|uniref:Sugar phosphate isomerase/epimerase n=2 Tax=Methanococcus voltae TaxID=2188 RepID=A0A8J7S0P3_METVO|nr:TIM barrel protein [Methanococcus voltae]MBP2171817.1 sugar phosphate isomerase/epimerase [Methanococcus voltae]MBP2201245.1 sugar phosphate isomerase/epimerase [Methanococcus voltae]MCS3922813.1 sugar phosphate isomerase/epimerase [Methanococcus voltae PS]